MTVLLSIILQNAHWLSVIMMLVILLNYILQCLFCSEVTLQNALLLSVIMLVILVMSFCYAFNAQKSFY